MNAAVFVSAVLLSLVVLAAATPVGDKDTASLTNSEQPLPPSETIQKASDSQDLIQSEASTEAFVVDYPGCGLGFLWCSKFKEANISASEASRISMGSNGLYDEWFFEGKPTCIARGNHYDRCRLDDVLVCAGGRSFGYAQDQAAALKAAISSPDKFHPDCPGCARGRTMDHMTSICIVAKGDKCAYQCSVGYVPHGDLVCNDNSTLEGGACIPATVNTELHELYTPTPTPAPTPTLVLPSVVPTAADVAHENWTSWESDLKERSTKAYRTFLSQDLCNYLLDLENDFQIRGVMPDLRIRSGVYVAGRAAECAWVHDNAVSTNQERKQRVPVRGDHGPWPEWISPNTVHVRVEGYGVVAIQLPNLHHTSSSSPAPLGRDLANAVASRLAITPDKFTIYLPNSIHPVDELTDLSSLNLKYTDFLTAKFQHLASHNQHHPELGELLSWSPSFRVDSDSGPIAP